MIFYDITRLMEKMQYQRVRINVPEVYLYEKRVQEQSLYVFLADTKNRVGEEATLVKGMVCQLKQKLELRDANCQFLSIVITDQISEFKELAQMDSLVWLIDRTKKMLMIYENQKDGFGELRGSIEEILDQYPTQPSLNTVEMGLGRGAETEVRYSLKETISRFVKQQPICCVSIVALNVIIFLIIDLFLNHQQYETLMNELGVQWAAIRYQKEYYRLFSYMFLHSGIDHLFNNMIVLFFVGQSLERVITKPKFLAIYFGSGIIAGAVSMGYNMLKDEYVLSIGASGAIFGLVGAMLYAVIVHRGRLQLISTRQIMLFIVFSLYGGFASSNVDNAAHIGGFLAGIVLATILIRKENRKEREN